MKIPRTEEEIIEFIQRSGLIGLSLFTLYLLFNLIIFDKIVLSEPNRMILYLEVGLVSGILGSMFVKPKKE